MVNGGTALLHSQFKKRDKLWQFIPLTNTLNKVILNLQFLPPGIFLHPIQTGCRLFLLTH
jgi:ribosome-associated toxin RatA of RatAB toxin-antitoxin module